MLTNSFTTVLTASVCHKHDLSLMTLSKVVTKCITFKHSFQTMYGTFTSSINTYCLAIFWDPGDGKSVTYSKVITPVLEAYTQRTGQILNLETYTQAGIHNNQVDNEGYGLISSDERHQFLSSVQNKERNGDAEKTFLVCKMWSG